MVLSEGMKWKIHYLLKLFLGVNIKYFAQIKTGTRANKCKFLVRVGK